MDVCISDMETITVRQDVVAELTEKSEVFYNLQAVISRFLDIEHLLSLCVQVRSWSGHFTEFQEKIPG